MGGFAEYESYDALGLASLVARGDLSPDDLLEAALDRVDDLDPKLTAIANLAIDQAKTAIHRGLPDGPFRGVPFLLKDLGAEAIGFPSNNGSALFKNTHHPIDSALVSRLKAAGLVIFGRTTSPELGNGPVTEAKVYGGPTRSPWDLNHTAGGSSGGAGAAVAAGMLPAAHGSDGGGSVRIPASSAGLFGMKATRARLPDGPAAGEGWAGMSIAGFLTRSVRDSAALLDATHGADLGAPYWAPPLKGSFKEAIQRPPKRQKIAFTTKTFDGEPVHPDCGGAVEAAATLCADLGHHVEEVNPTFDVWRLMQAWTKVVACGLALTVAHQVSARQRPLEAGELEAVTHDAVAYAASIQGTDYLAAVNTIHRFGRDIAAFFVDHDLLLTSTLAEPPARIGRFAPDREDFLDYRLGTEGIFRYSPFAPLFNASGQPAMSLPLAVSSHGLPIGVHIAGRFGADLDLIALAAELEQAASWFDRRPPLRMM